MYKINIAPVQQNTQETLHISDFAPMPMPNGDAALRPGIFVTKLEVWLRFANLPYKIASSSPQAAPKGQVALSFVCFAQFCNELYGFVCDAHR